MLHVDCARWGGTAEGLRHVALSAPHARTRERALALSEITQGSCATRVAARTGRHPQTVMGWVHAYNAQGPDTLAFRRTGGRPPCMGFTVSSVSSSVRTQSAGRNRDRPRGSLGGAWPLHLVSGRPSQGT